MAPSSPTKMPQSAYHLYFRFYRNVTQHPSLQMHLVKLDKTRVDLYKNYVKMVLDSNLENLSFEKKGGGHNFLGNDSFVGMSKKVSQKWKGAGELTRSIFKELAKEDRERYQRELFDAYQSFTRKHSSPIPALGFNLSGMQPQPQRIPGRAPSPYKKINAAKGDTEMANTSNGTKTHIVLKSESYASQKEKVVLKMKVVSSEPTMLVGSPTEYTSCAFLSSVTFPSHKERTVDSKELNDFLRDIAFD